MFHRRHMTHRHSPCAFSLRVLWVLACLVGFGMWPTAAAEAPSNAASNRAARAKVVEAVLAESPARQLELVKALALESDPVISQLLTAWRQGALFLQETDTLKVPFQVDGAPNADGKSRGIRVLDGAPLAGPDGSPLLLETSDLSPADTDAKLRRAIKSVLDLQAVNDPSPKTRRDAVIKLGQEQNPDYVATLEARRKTESDPVVRKALEEAVALIQTGSEDSKIRVAAVEKLGALRSIGSLNFLQKLETEAKADPKRLGEETQRAAHAAVVQIEDYMRWGNLFGTAFRGLSLAAVLLVAALGLAITFGLMGVINMAHGEVMMVGAYTAYVVQNAFRSRFEPGSAGFEWYFIAALLASFISGGVVGLILERGVIRFLYKRPLESLLATWGVSLVLQQLFRHVFGAANVQVSSPGWLSGSFVIWDVLFAYNRLFVIGFAVFVVLLTYALLTRTSLGLQIRAVMQNRSMAACLGVRTTRVNMLTFAFGSGLASMAGACLSQIGNVGPSLGQNYIVDCFMVVVLGGVGNLVGTVFASLGVGVTDQVLQPWLGAVMGKITVLAAIIVFLQWRPAGLFATRSRSLEG